MTDITPPEEDTLLREIYDKLHAEWCNVLCLPECDEFFEQWTSGHEFTADDLALVAKVTEEWTKAHPPEEVFYSTSGIVASGGPSIITSGHSIYSGTSKHTTSTWPAAPIRTAAGSTWSTVTTAAPVTTWSGERVGRMRDYAEKVTQNLAQSNEHLTRKIESAVQELPDGEVKRIRNRKRSMEGEFPAERRASRKRMRKS